MGDRLLIIKVAPCDPPCVNWRVTLPQSPVLSGQIECGSRALALEFAHRVADMTRWTIREQVPEPAPASTTEETNR